MITTDNHPVEGRVVQPASAPRSYVVETPSGEVRRNRSQLNVLPDQSTVEQSTPSQSDNSERPADDNQSQEQNQESATAEPRRIQTRSQTGTAIRPPDRLKGEM